MKLIFSKVCDVGYEIYDPTFQIPQVNLDSPDAERVNQEIYDRFYDQAVNAAQVFDAGGETELGWVQTSYKINNDVLSLVILESNYMYYMQTYYTYNFSLKDGHLMTDEEVLDAFNMDRENFLMKARRAIGEVYKDQLSGVPEELLEMSREEAYIDGGQICISESGSLGLIMDLYTVAGSGYYTTRMGL